MTIVVDIKDERVAEFYQLLADSNLTEDALQDTDIPLAHQVEALARLAQDPKDDVPLEDFLIKLRG
jgi:hypothetical protein